MTYFCRPMNITALLSTLEKYLVTEEKNRKIYHLPEIIALRINLATIRAQYPQTTLNIDDGAAVCILTVE